MPAASPDKDDEGKSAALVSRMRFVQPVRVGDTLHAEVEVLSRQETSKGDRGVLNSLFQVKNQKGEVVMQYEIQQLVQKWGAV